MDIFFRLRFLFWVLVVGLAGTLVKQFYFDDFSSEIPQLQRVQNPYKTAIGGPETVKAMEPEKIDLAAPPEAPQVALQPSAAYKKEEPAPATDSPAPMAPAGVGYAPPPSKAAAAFEPTKSPMPPPNWQPQTPPGFTRQETRHFVFLSQSKLGQDFLDNMEALHLNVMLDLAAFSPWAQEEKITIYLYDTQAAYQKFTGRPSWSGGASSLSRRSIYAYKSDELMGILAHEMTHIFFESFFGDRPCPLWLDEGLATFIQSERGFSPPNWLAPNIERLNEGGGYPLDKLTRVTTTSGADDDSVRLWYAQSYSLIRFMLRMQRGPAFLHFCRELRDGGTLGTSLIAAYGMPFNRVKALELAWRYDLSGHKLTSRESGEALR